MAAKAKEHHEKKGVKGRSSQGVSKPQESSRAPPNDQAAMESSLLCCAPPSDRLEMMARMQFNRTGQMKEFSGLLEDLGRTDPDKALDTFLNWYLI